MRNLGALKARTLGGSSLWVESPFSEFTVGIAGPRLSLGFIADCASYGGDFVVKIA